MEGIEQEQELAGQAAPAEADTYIVPMRRGRMIWVSMMKKNLLKIILENPRQMKRFKAIVNALSCIRSKNFNAGQPFIF